MLSASGPLSRRPVTRTYLGGITSRVTHSVENAGNHPNPAKGSARDRVGQTRNEGSANDDRNVLESVVVGACKVLQQLLSHLARYLLTLCAVELERFLLRNGLSLFSIN